MFASKIWVFLVTIGATIALTIALVLPHSANSSRVEVEHTRLGVACGVVNILLGSDARNRVDLTGSFARTPEVVAALEQAGASDKLDDARARSVKDVGENVMKTIQGPRKPDFAIMIDKRGRVAARVRLDEADFGDTVAGRPLVDDALGGYLRDDLWIYNGTLYLVSAAPVIKKDTSEYVGAVVLGNKVTTELAQRLVGEGLNVDVSFFLGNDEVTNTKPVALDRAALVDQVKKLSGGEFARDCQANRPFDLHAGSEDYSAIVARLPGEAGARQAYYAVYVKKPDAKGMWAYFNEARDHQGLSFDNFPWLLVAGAFVVALALGIGLMFFESDRPLRRLTADAVKLAKGETERLPEDVHPGKFGTIARSVNIHIDKLGREAKSAKKDLDQLLGPAPEGSLGTIDLLATALPSVRPGGSPPAMPPPPSEFRFSNSGAMPARPTPASAIPVTPASRVGTAPMIPGQQPHHTPAPARFTPQPEVQRTPPPALADDILGRDTIEEPPSADPYFKQVFDQFVAVKRSCHESTSGLTYQKFSEKLLKNRDDLMAKTGCREVRFTVYVKDGKAALKATPVKDEG